MSRGVVVRLDHLLATRDDQGESYPVVEQHVPKRTNAFQKLILRIYEQLALPTDKVEESVMVNERGSEVKREVDILLQRRVFGANMRIAVECRGRKDKDDIEWIDGLIGKYRDLDINVVFAVSKSGFTRAAVEKAKANRIETLTLKQALETNWPAEFEQLALHGWARKDVPMVSFQLAPVPLPKPCPPDFIPPTLTIGPTFFSSTGEEVMTAEAFAREIYRMKFEELDEKIRAVLKEILAPTEDVASKYVVADLGSWEPPNDLFVKDLTSQKLFRVKSLSFQVRSTFSTSEVPNERFVLGDAQVTLARMEGNRGVYTVMALQVAGQLKDSVKCHVELIQPAKKKNTEGQSRKPKPPSTSG